MAVDRNYLLKFAKGKNDMGTGKETVGNHQTCHH